MNLLSGYFAEPRHLIVLHYLYTCESMNIFIKVVILTLEGTIFWTFPNFMYRFILKSSSLQCQVLPGRDLEAHFPVTPTWKSTCSAMLVSNTVNSNLRWFSNLLLSSLTCGTLVHMVMRSNPRRGRIINILEINNNINNNNSVALVLERTIQTKRPPLVGEVSANLCW
jgi:hypothetical protein